LLGGEEAVLFRAEVFVEGVAGDPGALDDVRDGDRAIALLRDLERERIDDPRALVLGDELA
jgi:hypothetical protein